MEKQLKTFEDLEFKTHNLIPGAKHAIMKFEDGSEISVVGGGAGMLYGDGETTFEMMSNRTNSSHGVKGWLSKKQITNHMKYIQQNPLK